jgi:hypothetical protein
VIAALSIQSTLWGMRADIAAANRDRWTKSMQRQYSYESQQLNEWKIKTPDVDAIAQKFTQ